MFITLLIIGEKFLKKYINKVLQDVIELNVLQNKKNDYKSYPEFNHIEYENDQFRICDWRYVFDNEHSTITLGSKAKFNTTGLWQFIYPIDNFSKLKCLTKSELMTTVLDIHSRFLVKNILMDIDIIDYVNHKKAFKKWRIEKKKDEQCVQLRRIKNQLFFCTNIGNKYNIYLENGVLTTIGDVQEMLNESQETKFWAWDKNKIKLDLKHDHYRDLADMFLKFSKNKYIYVENSFWKKLCYLNNNIYQ